jgi:hypothetical protein
MLMLGLIIATGMPKSDTLTAPNVSFLEKIGYYYSKAKAKHLS